MTDLNDETATGDIVRACDEFRKAAFDEHEDDLATCEYVFRCVSIMKAHPRDGEIQISAALALTALCEKRKLGQFIGECGGLEALLVSLHSFIHDHGVVKSHLVLCRSLLACAENRHRFRIHSGLKLLVNAMDLHPKRSTIQRISCFLISVLSCEHDIERYRFVENGVIPSLMNVLQRFDIAQERSMHLDACRTLANLTRFSGFCTHVVNADFYLSAMSRLIEGSDDNELAYSTLCIFRNILTHHKTVKFPLSVGRRVTLTMLGFLDETSLEPLRFRMCHEVCFSLLRSELLNEDHVIEPVFFLRLCMTYVRAYLKTATTRLQEHAVVAHSCACLRLMLFAAHNRVDFRRIPESIETLVRAISLLSARPIRVEQALLALGNAIFDSEESQARADAANIFQIVAETMGKNHFNAAVIIASFQTIHAVCAKNHRTVEKAISLGTQTLCLKSLRFFKDNPHVQEAGLATITALAQTETGVLALHRSLALKVVRRAQEQFPFSQKILLLTESIADLMGEKTALRKQTAPTDEARKQSLAARLIRKLSSKPLTDE